jgi:hypothetical protein
MKDNETIRLELQDAKNQARHYQAMADKAIDQVLALQEENRGLKESLEKAYERCSYWEGRTMWYAGGCKGNPPDTGK